MYMLNLKTPLVGTCTTCLINVAIVVIFNFYEFCRFCFELWIFVNSFSFKNKSMVD